MEYCRRSAADGTLITLAGRMASEAVETLFHITSAVARAHFGCMSGGL